MPVDFGVEIVIRQRTKGTHDANGKDLKAGRDKN